MSILDYFKDGKCDLGGLAGYLDGLGHERRVDETRLLGGKQQALLWEAAEGTKPLTLEHFVPAGKPLLEEVIHWGKNSLPVFTKFQKRFCRPQPGAGAPGLWGYNE